MADATRFQVMSKQIDEQKQATETISTQIEKLTQSCGQIETLVQSQKKLESLITAFMSHGVGHQGGTPDPSCSQKNLESIVPRFFSQTLIPARPPSQPPDPPDFNELNLKFDGTLLSEWVIRCEQFFMKNNTPPEQKVRIVSFHMEGEAFNWHYDFIRNRYGIFPSWPDYIVALSARFGGLFDDPLSELMSLKQHDDSVETYFAKFERALSRLSLPVAQALNIFLTNMSYHLASHVRQFDVTTVADAVWIAKRCESSFLQHSSTTQNRAPFSPYQNYNNQSRNKSEFGNSIGPEIEFDRESEEIEDGELQDKQPEDEVFVVGVETLAMTEDKQPLEYNDESSVDEKLIEVIAEETAPEPMDESGCNFYKERNLNSLLCQGLRLLHFEESSDTTIPCLNLETKALSSLLSVGGIMLLSDSKQQSLLDPYADLPCSWHISSDMVCGFLQPLLIVAINSRTIFLNSRSIFVDDYEVALRRIVGDRFVLRMEEICLVSMKQNLEFAIDRGWVEFWTNTHDFTLTNYGLRLSPSEYTKNAFTLVYHLCKHSSFCLFLNTSTGCIGALLMVYDAKRLIQLDAPPVFSDLLCVMNRIRVRLKMVLLLELLWLILFTSKMFKSSNVHQNKNQTDQKLSSYWKLLLWLFHPLHINRWRSFFNVEVTSCSSYVKVLELIKDKASKKRKLCKNWWFKYKLNTWLSEAFHFWKYKKQINQGGLSASGFEMETWAVKKSLEWLNKLTIAISLAQMFLDHVCKLQGTPQDMLSDRDPTFLIELFRVLRADLSSDTTYEFIFVQPHPVHFPFRLEETLFAVVMDINFQKKEELIPMSKAHLSQGRNNAATKALVQWKEHPPDQATREFYQDLVAILISALRTSLFSTGEYCNRIYSLTLYLSVISINNVNPVCPGLA